MRKKLDKKQIIKDLQTYIADHSTKYDDMSVWNTYPIIVKDVACMSAVLKNNEVMFGDFNVKDKTFKCRHTQDDIDIAFVLETLEDMKSIDIKKKK